MPLALPLSSTHSRLPSTHFMSPESVIFFFLTFPSNDVASPGSHYWCWLNATAGPITFLAKQLLWTSSRRLRRPSPAMWLATVTCPGRVAQANDSSHRCCELPRLRYCYAIATYAFPDLGRQVRCASSPFNVRLWSSDVPSLDLRSYRVTHESLLLDAVFPVPGVT